MNDTPLISVCIVNYNHGDFLAQSIKSVLLQSYGNIELIIVDDGSTDNSPDIIKRYARRDERVHAHLMTQNNGAMAASNYALGECEGKYVFPRAADDFLIDMDFFQKAMHALQLWPDAAGVYGAAQIIAEGENTHVMGLNPLGVNMGWDGVYIGTHTAREMFLDGRLFIPGAASIWKTELVKEIGFMPALGPQADYYINHLLALKHGVVDLRRVVATVRYSASGYSVKGSGEYKDRMLTVQNMMRNEIPDMGDNAAWTKWWARA